MPTDVLTLLAPDRARHAEAMYDLIAKTFPIDGNYFNALHAVRGGFLEKGHYDWTTSRIGVLEGHLVTHFGVWAYTMRIGGARVRCAGIGAVATHGDYRKRGLMVQTARASLAAAREAGYDFSLLFGIPDFYHRFGFVVAWPEVTYTMSQAELPAEPPSVPVIPITPDQRQDLHELYNREHALVTGTAVRPTRSQYGPPNFWQTYLWLGEDGLPAGYLSGRADGGRFLHGDSAGDVEQRLRLLGQLARTAQCSEVVFVSQPETSPLAQRLRRLNVKMEVRHSRNGGPMIATLNLPSALTKMTEELSCRLQAHGVRWEGRLLISTAQEAATLEIAGTTVRVLPPVETPHAIHGGDALARLLLGSAPPEELVAQGEITVAGDAHWLVPTLFPAQYPMLPAPDRF